MNLSNAILRPMRDVLVIEEPAAATAALDPVRARLLHELAEPASAAGLAKRLGMPRQKINYHLRELERLGLVELEEIRVWGGINERMLRSVAATFVIAPTALPDGADPTRISDRISADYLVALGARLVTEVGRLARRASTEEKRLPTLSIDAEVGFTSAADRAAFAGELSESIRHLAAKYHHDGGRMHRVIVASHPVPPSEAEGKST